MDIDLVSVEKIVVKNDLTYHGETLLTYRIEYPQFRSARFRMCLLNVNRFYLDEARRFQKYCETELFRMAVEQYKDAIEHGFPIRMFEVLQIYDVTYLKACVISIYFDRYEYTGGAHGNTIRSAQTWNLAQCGLFELPQLVQCDPDCRSYVLAEVAAQIAAEPDIYFENYQELIAETFDSDHFYCTPSGIVIYYQQYDIAPYSSGIREFLIPYGGCVVSPRRFCR